MYRLYPRVRFHFFFFPLASHTSQTRIYFIFFPLSRSFRTPVLFGWYRRRRRRVFAKVHRPRINNASRLVHEHLSSRVASDQTTLLPAANLYRLLFFVHTNLFITLTMVEFAEKAKEILERIRGYIADKDGWKQAKKTVSIL